jgi:hypothetical protein
MFLDRWAIGHLLAEEIEARVDEALNDFANHDWSMMYRGNVLDD